MLSYDGTSQLACIDLLRASSEGHEGIADQTSQRKILQVLEDGLSGLHKVARQQHEVVSHLEKRLSSVVSEADLRRALGLSLQEFDHRLEDAFVDSARKGLAMFAKREEVSELQGQIGKKVGMLEFNSVLKKLTELRHYIDAMAESVFISHRDSLKQEFSKKADAHVVEEALKSKADFRDMTDVRARLERLEANVSVQDTKGTGPVITVPVTVAVAGFVGETTVAVVEQFTTHQSASFSTEQPNQDLQKQHQALITGFQQTVEALQTQNKDAAYRMATAERALTDLKFTVHELTKFQKDTSSQIEKVMMPTLKSIEERSKTFEVAFGRAQEDAKALTSHVQSLDEMCRSKLLELSQANSGIKQELAFILEELDAVKCRARETIKTNSSKFAELSGEQDKNMQQLTAFETKLKRQEREVRSIEKAARHTHDGAFSKPLPLQDSSAGGNDRLRSVLNQLVKIASSEPAHSRTGTANSPRPPLPYVADRCCSEGDAKLRGVSEDDIGRGPVSARTPRGMYGFSPRTPAASVGHSTR